MPKIVFIGAGSTIFAKNVLGDCILTDSLKNSEIALYDINLQRLKESEAILNNINKRYGGQATIKVFTDRKKALERANYVINAVQIGGYKPSTVIDFEIPKKYGLRQTIADTAGIGGIFRGLRTIPVILDLAKEMEELCPEALLINYSNPMAIITGALLRGSSIKTVGLCHSVQVCVKDLFKPLGMDPEGVQWKIAGINHMAWLLEVTKDGKDLYPEIKKKAAERPIPHGNMVRYEIMKHFGYYVTESSNHLSEYTPYFIKSKYPELIGKYNIALDDYIRMCEEQIERWNVIGHELLNNKNLEHERSQEYASYILEAMETDKPFRIHGNVMNTGLITNLPQKAVVEVPCLVDRSGITPCYVGDLPEQLAALNRTNINMQLLTIEAALTKKKEHIYHAAMLDPHTAAELSIDDIISLCDELIEAHGTYLPKYE
ncbi:alpha-glucosidase/alpha-galactosidase [Clostridium swellfunianum]|uniref:alpha-glucosidase/alpha-galactosidase n=1 Tax=Clostridium swellfunianum TaxID=1367462 RepID=UPI00203059C5|nr:alpha-glucosidase/alpha-galactosidase [Clostridium swellfunianum]MCM0649642.1 alpha-glucosidase/alpha-galactosidase [Clostridium swellfunianum]